jgi:hypothetical protein
MGQAVGRCYLAYLPDLHDYFEEIEPGALAAAFEFSSSPYLRNFPRRWWWNGCRPSGAQDPHHRLLRRVVPR